MVKSAITIAGSDSSGGAGIQADLKTFSALGVYGMSVITSITAQNTTGVYMIEDVSKECIYAQIKACFDDIRVYGVKVGMLSNSETIDTLLDAFIEFAPRNIVIDPVMVSTTGSKLLSDDGLSEMKKLFRLATLITPNRREAEALTGISITDLDSAKEAANTLSKMTNGAVLIKGVDKATDLYYKSGKYRVLEGEWIENKDPHGTGCTLSSAIVAYLAQGYILDQAVKMGKEFVTEAIRHGLDIGKGKGPTNPLYRIIE